MTDFAASQAPLQQGPQGHGWIRSHGAHIELAFVAVTVLLAPMNYFRASFAYITLGDVFALCSLVLMLARGRLPLRPFGPASSMWFASVLLLMAGLFAGSVLNGDAVDGALGTGQYAFSLLVLPALLLQRPPAEGVFLIKMLVLSMVLIMLHGAYAVAFTPEDGRFVSANGRLRSLIERENAAAAMAAIAMVFTLWLRLQGQLGRTAAAAAFLVLGYGLLLTGSNTGFFMLPAGLLLLACLYGSLRSLAALLAALLATVAAVYFWGGEFLPETFQRRVLGALRSGDLGEAGTFDDRLFLIREAAAIANSQILSGLGMDQYRLISAHKAPVHNTYLLVLAEGGLMALLGLAGLFLSGVYLAWSAWQRHGSSAAAALTLTVLLLLALALNGFAHFYARFWLVPWLLAVSVSLQPLAAPPPRLPRPGRRPAAAPPRFRRWSRS